MVVRKTKQTVKKAEKASTKKTTTSKTVGRGTKKSVKKTETKNVGEVMKKENAFQQRTLSKVDKNEKIPTWLIILFSFSLVFLLFALYKTFIYGQGYNFAENDVDENNTLFIEDIPEDLNSSLDELNYINEDSNFEASEEEKNNNIESDNNLIGNDYISNDIQLIQNFYSYLINNEVDKMNSLVDTPLKNSTTWNTHRSKKNIGIFGRHLEQDISLDNISYIQGSENKEKQTRKYGYTLRYAIDSGKSFIEDWEVTLISRNGTTLISEIMCKTEGCSRSPFFWPQNYGLE